MNRLTNETSPYLLQHQHNPVHWYAWGEQAFAAARSTGKPVLLSSGYAACHWCHVMAHESFEDPATAAFMNEHFINIKLDREERPDVDRLYMAALHAMGEQGGWPLNVFLTPEREPFWGGTYFPPEPRYGRPSFLQVLHAIDRLWQTDRDQALRGAATLTRHLQGNAASNRSSVPTLTDIDTRAETIVQACDMVNGGLKGAPKFPQAPIFNFLWQRSLTSSQPGLDTAVLATLQHISNGGIYDHLAGGIARYSTDAHWLVPHFEKMLYDNAQFISLASRVHLKSPSRLLADRVCQTVNFLLEEMRTAEGAFTSSFDADSEGEEGKYYVWSQAEIRQLLPPELAELLELHYGVTAQGNFEGHNILNRLSSPHLLAGDLEAQLATARDVLHQARKQRVPPLHDDKILADWNGLAITALTEAALVFQEPAWLMAAERAFRCNIELFWKNGQLWHSHRNGKTQHHATAHDYAHLIEAALALAALTADTYPRDIAQQLTAAFEAQHWSDAQNGFLLTAFSTNDLPANTIPIQDDVTGSPNAVMAKNYIRLSYLLDDTKFIDKARRILEHHCGLALSNPFAAPSLLSTAALLQDTVQITHYGNEHFSSPLLREAIKHTGLDAVIIPNPPQQEHPTLTICRSTVCSTPAENKKGVQDALSFVGLL